MRTRTGCSVILLIALCAGSAFGHDPLNSFTIAQLHADRLEVRIRLATETARMLLEGPRVTGGDLSPEMLATLRSRIAMLYEVSAGGVRLTASATEVELDEEDGVEFLLIYPRPDRGPLRFEATFLKELPADHRSSLSVLNQAGDALSLTLPTPDDPVSEVAFESASVDSPESAHIEDPDAESSTGQVAEKQGVSSAAGQAVATEPGSESTFWRFLKLGVEHILTGYDHLLFLCGLLIACRRFSTMAAIITCFTLAHSLTLGLAALDLITVSGRLVEPLIAASIGYVGIENLLRKEEPTGRWALTFGFGLIHGFGFAAVLKQLGLGLASSKASLVVPLFSFNLGVELGQIAVTAVVWPLLWKLRNLPGFARHGTVAVSAAVALLGVFLVVQRLFFL